jgi:pyruvate dehydrogenase E1 component alpha subunit
MHLTSVKHGAMGSYAIVGAHLTIAAGAAWSAQYRGTDQVAVCFFGDGTTNIGAFHEALNFAVIWKLPVVFVCENNLYAYSVPVEKSMAIDDVADRAESYGFEGVSINGNDVLAVYQSTQGALARARNGEGPTLIECKTYRWHGHSEHDKAFYRTDEELAMWKSRDPIPTFTTYLQARSVLSGDKLKEIEDRVTSTIDDAVDFATNAPDPKPEDAVTDLYA